MINKTMLAGTVKRIMMDGTNSISFILDVPMDIVRSCKPVVHFHKKYCANFDKVRKFIEDGKLTQDSCVFVTATIVKTKISLRINAEDLIMLSPDELQAYDSNVFEVEGVVSACSKITSALYCVILRDEVDRTSESIPIIMMRAQTEDICLNQNLKVQGHIETRMHLTPDNGGAYKFRSSVYLWADTIIDKSRKAERTDYADYRQM